MLNKQSGPGGLPTAATLEDSPRRQSYQGLSFLETALRYCEDGFRVLPLSGKKPHSRFAPHGVYSATLDEATIGKWWDWDKPPNIGIACGAVSGIVVLDVDPRHGGERSLADLVRVYGELPETLVVRTGRGDGGRHYYYLHPGRRVGNRALAAGIDVRGDGAYIVAPPSLHPETGNPYVGNVRRDRIAAPPEFITDRVATNHTPTNSIASVSSVSSVSLTLCSVEIDKAIAVTLPTTEGKRNAATFAFARRLKAIPELAHRPVDELRDVVRRWHAAALPIIGTKAFDETWADFVVGWPRVRCPHGAAVLAEAWDRARASPLPPAADRYESDGLRLLVALCAQLQRISGTSPFFLACRNAGGLLGIEHTTAAKWLGLLVHDRILTIVVKGTPPHSATRYRFVGEVVSE